MKQILKIYPAPAKHWVGDGFHVHSMFHYQETHKNLDPFLLMDYASPEYFAPNPTAHHRGVGEHPHRGFETVTIAYQGEVAHADASGGTGVINTGDVQWMTAGAGVMHEEFHSDEFSRQGGMFEMVQLWVNLPAKDKMTTPKYQAIESQNIPVVDLGHNAIARIIAGEFTQENGEKIIGTATTFSPINLWDIRLTVNHGYDFIIPVSHNLLILVLDGEVQINDGQITQRNALVTFTQGGENVRIYATQNAKILLLSGEPLNEPIAGHGPFVMNTREQLMQTFHDYQTGKFVNIQR